MKLTDQGTEVHQAEYYPDVDDDSDDDRAFFSRDTGFHQLQE
jgi:hypothetical protein